MKTRAQGVPQGYHSITPYVCAPSADALVAFLTSAFGATTVERNERDDGSVAHAEVDIGGSKLMLCDATDQHPAAAAMLYLYVADTDATYRQAMAAGGKSIMEPADRPYGDRNAGVSDPAGNQWWIATRLANARVEPDEEGTA